MHAAEESGLQAERWAGRRVAFFGGSFDPPHLGHLAVARAAQAALALDTVLFAPVGAQPLKPRGSTAGFEDRVTMTRLAIAGEPAFRISLADAPTATGAPNYTVDTLHALRAELPAGGELYCLMGADSFLNLRHWHRAAEIPFAAHLIVASRPRESLDNLGAALPAGLAIRPAPELAPKDSGVAVICFRIANESGQSAPFYVLPGLHIEISATAIRRQAPGGKAGGLLPAAVAEYIRAHGLYK